MYYYNRVLVIFASANASLSIFFNAYAYFQYRHLRIAQEGWTVWIILEPSMRLRVGKLVNAGMNSHHIHIHTRYLVTRKTTVVTQVMRVNHGVIQQIQIKDMSYVIFHTVVSSRMKQSTVDTKTC